MTVGTLLRIQKSKYFESICCKTSFHSEKMTGKWHWTKSGLPLGEADHSLMLFSWKGELFVSTSYEQYNFVWKMGTVTCMKSMQVGQYFIVEK